MINNNKLVDNGITEVSHFLNSPPLPPPPPLPSPLNGTSITVVVDLKVIFGDIPGILNVRLRSSSLTARLEDEGAGEGEEEEEEELTLTAAVQGPLTFGEG